MAAIPSEDSSTTDMVGGKPKPAPVMFLGLDLRAIHPSAFKTSRMWDKRYHLRSARFVIYQLAMIVPLAAECLATVCLVKYDNLGEHARNTYPGVKFHAKDMRAGLILGILSGVFAATIFASPPPPLGSFFFFLLFWPTIHETWVTKICKELAAWAVLLLTLGTAIWSTFVISQRTAYANGATEEELAQIHTWQPPFHYKDYPPVIAFIVLFWVGWLFIALATVMVSVAAAWNMKNGSEPQDYEKGRRHKTEWKMRN